MKRRSLPALSACAVAVLVFVGSHVGAQPAPSADRALAREILEELVEIPTTREQGTARAAQAIAARLLPPGFQKKTCTSSTPMRERRNVVARFRGRNPGARGVLLMAHLDVVPARREDWSVDPWTFLERDGWFYGRGTTDNKAGAAMLVANFITLKRAGWQPARDLDHGADRRRRNGAEEAFSGCLRNSAS